MEAVGRCIVFCFLSALSIGGVIAPAAALSVSGIEARAGVLWIGNSSNQGAPSPLLDSIGAALPLAITPELSVAPEIDFFGTQYQLALDGVRAIPANIEYQSTTYYQSVLLDLPIRFRFVLSKSLSLGLGVSPSFLFRIPLPFVYPSTPGAPTGTMSAYFYDAGRFFYPATQAFFDWQALPKLSLELRLRALFPLFHLWDGEGLPFYDQLIAEVSLGFRFSF